MTAEHAATTSQDQPQPTKNGWLKNLLLIPVQWWPVTMITIIASVIAALPYYITALQAQNGHLLSAAGVAAFGLALNLLPPLIVWATLKWTS